MSAPIRMRARREGDLVEVTLLMPHPMETGLRRGADGACVPAHYITDVRVALGQRTVFDARMSMAVARDPLLTFRFRGARAGDRLRVGWRDNQGDSRSDEATIP